MPHKNRKCRKKMNQADGGESAMDNKSATANVDQLQTKEIEQVASVLKCGDLVRRTHLKFSGRLLVCVKFQNDVPFIISLAILQKKEAILKLLKQGCNINEFGPVNEFS